MVRGGEGDLNEIWWVYRLMYCKNNGNTLVAVDLGLVAKLPAFGV